MKHPGLYAAGFGLAALMLGGCLDADDPAPVRANPSLDPVAGRTLLEPVDIPEDEEVDPTAQPTLPTDPPATHVPLSGLNAEGAVVLVRSAP